MKPGLFLSQRRTLRGQRVLVVEDEALVAMLCEDGLRDAGAEVLGPTGSVGEAMQLIEQVATDGGLSAAVLDFNLGGEAVSPVADRLVELGVPFLFATGYGEACPRGAHTAIRVLAKPFSPEALVTAVEGLTGSTDDAPARRSRPGKMPADSALAAKARRQSSIPSVRR